MSENLTFDKTYNYSTLKIGISLPVILKSGENSIQINAKLDTGSSHCIFERQYGELLEIDVESGASATIGTATGNFPAFEHRIEISTFGFIWEASVYFIAEEGIKRNILGRIGWLDRVKLGLIDYEGKLLLSRYLDEN